MKYPPKAFRSCRGILSLERKFGLDRLVAACACASELRRYGYMDVLSILNRGDDADFMPSAESENRTGSTKAPVRHKNIRGKDYYTTSKSNLNKTNRNGNKQ